MESFKKYKSKPQGDTTSHFLGGLSLQSQRVTDVGRDAEESDRPPHFSGNVT